MELISQIKKIENKISGKFYFDQSLSKYSWFNLGGLAKVIFIPKNLNELSIFLKNIVIFFEKIGIFLKKIGIFLKNIGIFLKNIGIFLKNIGIYLKTLNNF